MNIEEAKANIGKEVVLLEDTKPYRNNEGVFLEKYVYFYETNALFISEVANDTVSVLVKNQSHQQIGTASFHTKHIALKEPKTSISGMSLSQSYALALGVATQGAYYKGFTPKQVETINDMLKVINLELFWKKEDELKQQQQEIESLKAQLAQYQSDDCVLVPTAKINVAWQDTSEPENMVFKFSDLNMLGDCYEIGDLVEIEYYKSAYFNHQTVYGTWNKDKTHFFVGSKEECNAMIETAEKEV